jgi:hypothetical protein
MSTLIASRFSNSRFSWALVNASYNNSEVQKVDEINKWTIDTKLLKVGE